MNDLFEASSEAPQGPRDNVVMKFGGTSVEDAAAIRRLCRMVVRHSSSRHVVVASAM